MTILKQLGGLFLVGACFLFASVPLAHARDDDQGLDGVCSDDMNALLSDVTIFGVASWGENWVEYHNPDGTSVLSNTDLSNPKRGTWVSDNCREVCYGYADGGGWCPQWREVEGGWVNILPDTEQVVHRIYLFERGDVMNLEGVMDRADALAGRI